jgi:hypothetical protein
MRVTTSKGSPPPRRDRKAAFDRESGSESSATKKAQRLVYHRGSLPISAAFRLRYGRLLMRGWGCVGNRQAHMQARGGWNGNWGEWGPGDQIRL